MSALGLTWDFDSLIGEPENWNQMQDNMNDMLVWASGGIDNSNLDGSAGITADNLSAQVKQAQGLSDTTTTRSGQVSWDPQGSQLSTQGQWHEGSAPITITIPPGGLVEVYATATLESVSSFDVLLGVPFDWPDVKGETVSVGAVLGVGFGPPQTLFTLPGSSTGTSLRQLAGWLTYTPLKAGPQEFRIWYLVNEGLANISDARLFVRALLP